MQKCSYFMPASSSITGTVIVYCRIKMANDNLFIRDYKENNFHNLTSNCSLLFLL